MTRDILRAQRLRKCLEKLEGYPEWPPDLRQKLGNLAAQLSEGQKKACLLGRELNAALEDSRLQAELE